VTPDTADDTPDGWEHAPLTDTAGWEFGWLEEPLIPAELTQATRHGLTAQTSTYGPGQRKGRR